MHVSCSCLCVPLVLGLDITTVQYNITYNVECSNNPFPLWTRPGERRSQLAPYGIGAYFAIQQAIKAFNKNYTPKFHSPFTPEKVLMSLYEK